MFFEKTKNIRQNFDILWKLQKQNYEILMTTKKMNEGKEYTCNNWKLICEKAA